MWIHENRNKKGEKIYKKKMKIDTKIYMNTWKKYILLGIKKEENKTKQNKMKIDTKIDMNT